MQFNANAFTSFQIIIVFISFLAFVKTMLCDVYFLASVHLKKGTKFILLSTVPQLPVLFTYIITKITKIKIKNPELEF